MTTRSSIAAALRAELRRELQRKDLLEYTKARTPGYEAGRFHRVVADELMEFSRATAARESPRLILAAPPRHGKTVLCSHRLPVWHLGHNPGHSVIAASYGQTLATQNSRAARRIAAESVDLWPHLQPGEPATVEQWGTAGGGQFKAIGVGGGIAGYGANMGIIDDPIRNLAEASSKVYRDRAWDWFRADIYTRLAPGGGLLLMATRWHHDDPTGRLLSMMEDGTGEAWRVVEFPAECWEIPGPLDWRRPGEALHPARYPLDYLHKAKQLQGARIYEALYQQRPTPDAGAMFRREWFRFHNKDPWTTRWDDAIISVDATFKGGDGTDYVVMQSWGRLGADYYLLDRVRERMDFPTTVRQLVAFRNRHHYVRAVLVEDKANGPAIISTLQRSVPGLIAITPTESKEARAHAASVCYESGNVWHPSAPWVGLDLEPELLAFPAGAHDDQVDAMSQAINRWRNAEVDAEAVMRSRWGFVP